MKKVFLAVPLALVLLAGCSKPADHVIPSDMAAWDKDLAPVLQKLSEEDRKLMAAYLVRVKMGEVFGGAGVPVGTTIGAALADQKKWAEELARKQAEEKALKEKLEQERQAAVKAINDAVTVTLLKKGELPKNYDVGRYSEQQSFDVGIKNNSDKAIAGVSGELEFVDLFDKVVGSVSFRISETIAPGGDYRWKGVRDYNQFVAEHRAVWNLEEGKYKTRFVPEAVVFKDGSSLKAPN